VSLTTRPPDVIDVRDGGGDGEPPRRDRPTRTPPRPHRRLRPRELTSADYGLMVGCFVSSLSLCWLIFERLTTGTSALGFFIVAYLVFLALFVVVSADRYGRLIAVDRVMTVIMVSGGIIVLIPLVLLVGDIIVQGIRALRFSFFLHDQAGITPTQPATAGGGAHALVGTLEEVGLALVWSLPLGLAAAVFLNESRSKWRRPVRIFVDAMSGLPSIVAGLFIFAVFILPYAHVSDLFKFNGFMASLALALLMLPTITRTVEVVLRLVPDGLREASLAMGASRFRTTWSVVFPTARTGITTAVVLGIARAVGETAPLLFTSFGYNLMNANPFSKPQESLPLFVYTNVRAPDLASIARGYTGALVLLVLVLSLFIVARIVGRDRSRRMSRTRRRPTTPNLQERTAT
jgi:phosphate transport system permease protein